MKKESIIYKIKRFVSSVSFKLFLWGIGLSKEDYWTRIYEQEKEFIGNSEQLRFAEFAVNGFWFDSEYGLWESLNEGEEFVINGEALFRFNSKELYQIFASHQSSSVAQAKKNLGV